MNLGRIVRRARAVAHDRLGLTTRAHRRLDGSCAAILNYHRVIPESQARRDFVEPGVYVTPESFGQQLDWLNRYFRVLPLHEVGRALLDRRSLPERACSITFDDGWQDNYEHALPELARRGLPATIFVVTRRVGSDGAFWPDEVCRRVAPLSERDQHELASRLGVGVGPPTLNDLLEFLKRQPEDDRNEVLDELRSHTEAPRSRGRELMNWDELGRLSGAGIDIESHGATHAILTGLRHDQAVAEMRDSLADLRARGLGRHGLLAYPSGGYDGGVMKAAREVGYRAAVTIEDGLASKASDVFALPRLCVHQGIASSREEFLFKIPGRA
jgi:peptidoglycan/xylan/chitin deacetylase (PgdA/CDA1 family)